MEENYTVPKSFWDKFIAPLFAKEPEKVEVVKTVEPEDYAATKQERDDLKAQIETQRLEAEKKVRVEKFDAELKETKADPALSELLADLPAEQAEAIMKQFKALSAQINDTELLKEKGTEGAAVDDPKAAFNAAVLAISAEKKINYNAAFEEAKVSHADLFREAFVKK